MRQLRSLVHHSSSLAQASCVVMRGVSGARSRRARIWLRFGTLATQGGRGAASSELIPATPVDAFVGRDPTLALLPRKPARSTSDNCGFAHSVPAWNFARAGRLSPQAAWPRWTGTVALGRDLRRRPEIPLDPPRGLVNEARPARLLPDRGGHRVQERRPLRGLDRLGQREQQSHFFVGKI